MSEANIYDLTAQEGASAGVPHTPLLIEALTAIYEERLTARCEYNTRSEIKRWITVLEHDPHFFIRQFRFVFVDPTKYHNLRQTKQGPATQRKRPPSPKSLEAAIRSHLAEQQKQGGRSSQKDVWAWAQAAVPGAAYGQVLEAMKTVVGKRGKGRPRKTISTTH
jgi:hypothetical protein